MFFVEIPVGKIEKKGRWIMGAYTNFKEIIDTMESQGYDWKQEIGAINKAQKKRNEQVEFSLSDHVKAMVYAMLSSNRPWDGIARNSDKINAVFKNFDVDYLLSASPTELEQQLTEIKCGNLQIKRQMNNLRSNIKTLQQIATDFGSIDDYYNSTDKYILIKSLSNSGQKYKLKYMGVALVCEYLKGVGVDIIKPDVHVRRIIGRLGYSKHNPATVRETMDVCKAIAEEYNLSQAAVDAIFWQYGANAKFKICDSAPKCNLCNVKNCPSRKILSDIVS